MTRTSDPDLENGIVFVYDSEPILAEDSSPTLPATPRALVLAELHALGES